MSDNIYLPKEIGFVIFTTILQSKVPINIPAIGDIVIGIVELCGGKTQFENVNNIIKAFRDVLIRFISIYKIEVSGVTYSITRDYLPINNIICVKITETDEKTYTINSLLYSEGKQKSFDIIYKFGKTSGYDEQVFECMMLPHNKIIISLMLIFEKMFSLDPCV